MNNLANISIKGFLIEVCVSGVILLIILVFIFGNGETGKIFPAVGIYGFVVLIMTLYWLPIYLLRRNLDLLYQGNILKRGMVTCHINLLGFYGILVLTHNELVFKSHPWYRKHFVVIPLEDCVNISEYNYLGLVLKGIQIKRNDGTVEKFVVQNNRKVWIETIQQAIAEKVK